MNNGAAASFHDNSAHGEDTFLIRELTTTASLDGVLDGVSHCGGGYASGFTLDTLQDAPITTLNDLLAVLELANNTLFQGGGGRNLLTTTSVALKLGDELHVINVGDSPVYLIRGGEARELSTNVKPGTLPGLLTEALGVHESFTYEYRQEILRPQDILILATDGLTNNVFPEELAAIVSKAASPDEAVAALKELVGEKQRLHIGREDSYGTFREDDRTAIIRYLD